MPDVIELSNEFYIHARSSLVEIQTRVLMRGDVFAVFDRSGDLWPLGLGGHGLFYNDSRHLSKSILRLGNTSLLLLSPTVTQDNARFSVELTHPPPDPPDCRRLPHPAVHFHRP